MSMRHILNGAVLAGMVLTAFATAADARPRHPPGPDRCWAWTNHHWVRLCSVRSVTPILDRFPTLYSGPAFTDPGYPNRSWSDPGTFDPSYYDRFVIGTF